MLLILYDHESEYTLH